MVEPALPEIFSGAAALPDGSVADLVRTEEDEDAPVGPDTAEAADA